MIIATILVLHKLATLSNLIPPHLSRKSGLAVEALGTGDTPPVTFVLCGVVVGDADFVEP